MPYQKLVLIIPLSFLVACSSFQATNEIEPLAVQGDMATIEPYRYDTPLRSPTEPPISSTFPLCNLVIPALYHDNVDKDFDNYCHVCARWSDGECDESMAVYLFRDFSRPEERIKEYIEANPICASYDGKTYRWLPVSLSLAKTAYECELNEELNGLYFTRVGFYVELTTKDSFPPRLVGEQILENIQRLITSEDCDIHRLGICIYGLND